MLDYTDHVSFCTKLKETLREHKQWSDICHVQSKSYLKTSEVIAEVHSDLYVQFLIRLSSASGNARSLKHLCRLRIREHLTHLRLRAPVFISYLPLPPRLQDYLRYKEFDVYGRGSIV